MSPNREISLPDRRLAAIMFTDIVGYTTLMGNDERKAFEYLQKNREIQKPIIKEFHGRWIKELGDGVMASFNTVSDAISAAIRIQEACNLSKTFQLRIGIHQGEVVFEKDDVFGDAVNIAARIQSAANPGCIYVSESVYHNVANKKGVNTRFVKEEILKNVKHPVKIYEVYAGNGAGPNKDALIEKAQARTMPEKSSTGKSIAVLPFVNMSNDPEQEYFSEGMAEEIINSLAHLKELKVAGRSSAFQFKGKNIDLKEVGEKLKVKTILEGSIRKQGNKVRITAQLININDGFHLWSEKYDRNLDDIFAIQDEIALAITERLKVTLQISDREQITKIYTQNTEAYQLYLQGRFFWNRRTEKGIETSKRYFLKALEKDPKYALAWAGLSDAYIILMEYGNHARKETFSRAKAAVTRALELDSSLAEAHISLGLLLMLDEWDWENASKEYKLGIDLNPNYATGHHWYGEWLMYCGKFEEAFRQFSLAVELDPVSVGIHKDKALFFYYNRQYDKAIEQTKKTLELDPNFAAAHRIFSLAHQGNKMYDLAIAENKIWGELTGDLLITSLTLAQIYAAAGRKEEARALAENQVANELFNLDDFRNLSLIYGDLGDMDKAFQYLVKCYERRDMSLASLKIDPKFDMLRADPRFDKILKRIGFPE